MARRRSQSSLPRLILVLLLMLVCLGAALLLVGLEVVPDQARRTFGPASVTLDPIDRWTTSARLLLSGSNLIQPVDPLGVDTDFTVRAGESPNSVSFRLEEAGLIRDPAAFRLYLIYAGFDRSIQAGDYRLSPRMSGLEIAQTIQDATSKEVTLRVLAGWRAEEIAESLPYTGLSITPDDFMRVVRLAPADWLPVGWPNLTNLEGFLAPGEYTFPREATVDVVVRALFDRFVEQADADLLLAFERQGLSLREAVTLASIVEKEGVVPDERPLIASVFYNRLADAMKLDSDPTVQYALGFNWDQDTWWTNPLSLDNLQFDSAYNTYRYTGLPPGPICEPSLSSLEAVAYPAQTPYYYFRARCDGSGQHAFAITYEEHLQNACQP
jgi:UPF0755 protein